MIENTDLKVECYVKEEDRGGMRPAYERTSLRVTHLPTGIIIDIPYAVGRHQYKKLRYAREMLEVVLLEINNG